MTSLNLNSCPACGATPNDMCTTAGGHFLVNDQRCPLDTPSCVPLAVVERRRNGEVIDIDGWRKPRDLRDEALEDLRKQNAELRSAVEKKDAEIERWTKRVKTLEERLDWIVEAARGQDV
jgi:uncharacterized protein YlxW (UPF0749 family)